MSDVQPDNIPTGLTRQETGKWLRAVAHIARHYRIGYSAGNLEAAANWQLNKPLPVVLKNLARQAGLKARILNQGVEDISRWRLPLVIQLDDGQIGVVKSHDNDGNVAVSLVDDDDLVNHYALETLLAKIRRVVALRPTMAGYDARTASYVTPFRPDWLIKLAMQKARPYWHVMLASLFVNILAMAGILYSMQVYDRVIPAQSYPTLYVLSIGVLIAVIFGFVLRVIRGHITDILGKQADIRISDRVFSHALRLRASAIPRSTGSFISQIRELEQICEMVTSTTVSALMDLPFFFLFLLVLCIISPQLAWIAPVATVIMLAPGLLLQKKMAALARQSVHESTLRNAVLVESVQGLEDIKLMQAENRFLQQWNNYIQVTAQSGVQTRKITQGLIAWGVAIQGLVYAAVVMAGAPLIINGDVTTGAIVAASQLSSRMISPMTALCGVLARWQQAKAAKEGLDAIMKLPTDNDPDEQRIACPVLQGDYHFANAAFRYREDTPQAPLRVTKLDIAAGERIAVLGRNGAGKSTLLQALAGGMDLIEGELTLDNLSLRHIDMADVRRNIGLLTQNARLFHGTLRDNLAMGAPYARDDEIFAALEVTGGAEFIRALPMGLDHLIMEGGSGLSGGQRQAVLLARLLLRDPNIVLLDEPTASLDDHTEREFLLRLGRWLAGRTLIVATHRTAVMSIVDRVLVLKEGQLVMDMPKEQALSRSASAATGGENEKQRA
ncbi:MULTISPECIES: type I secretion system permease/ATPase [Tenebrionibacter/Tenebrionicola group]|jgi:ATP-binding cassette subfamily C protein LapB|uniref:Type I secretion system permease/ATPase n=2 Tax=Tenebrionibacter/Tenebrionicola group TaxID=2969848 RepID=A0A8K0XVR5_9ENTR|nr:MULTISPECIES: type I secretion system permease/ATPase [Tenebrionibacter/Tenebrionicola group]MBK4714465.1 type I secretion system permease/ATPase [Tenebrionibacter intestinalis]MBV5095310.1 type I secretion system permease/ATPase [Tenebrionicola larvae]